MSRLVDDDAWGAMTVAQEASSEPFEGAQAVGEVIRRRAKEAGSVAAAVLAPYQFSGWNTTDPNRRRCAVMDADTFASAAWLASAGSNLAPDAWFYVNLDIVPNVPAWATPDKFVVKIGKHSFYRR
jgi:spore germination cell wall hydrolase CwlJ-like protein